MMYARSRGTYYCQVGCVHRQRSTMICLSNRFLHKWCLVGSTSCDTIQGTTRAETRRSDWLEGISVFISCDSFIILSNYEFKHLVHSYFDDVTVENGAVENEIQFLPRGCGEQSFSYKLMVTVVSPYEIKFITLCGCLKGNRVETIQPGLGCCEK